MSGRTVRSVSTFSGVITEYEIPHPNFALDHQPEGITVGSDGNLWFTEQARVARITPTGAISEFTLPIEEDTLLYAIAGLPDGILWFTDQGGGKVDKITTSGAITEYKVTPKYKWLGGIVLGPDGHVWFTAAGLNQVMKIGR